MRGPLTIILMAAGCTAFAAQAPTLIELPKPALRGKLSLEQTLAERRTVREYAPEALELGEVGQLLWAAQGVTDAKGFRTAPSAGAQYPLEIYAVAANVKGLAAGVYRYKPKEHALELAAPLEKSDAVAAAALGRGPMKAAPIVFLISAVSARTAGRFKGRTQRFIDFEAGHAAQNLLLQATALGLGAVPIGGFTDQEFRQVARLAEGEEPLYLIAAGRRLAGR